LYNRSYVKELEIMTMFDKLLGHRSRSLLAALALVSVAFISLIQQSAFALIMGGTGNSPVRDPGWPKGAAEIFNEPGRIAYWEGPPFGGGQWHSECRGDAKAFNDVLDKFARLDVKTKRLIIHDGIGRSFWLNPNRDENAQTKAEIDWTFMVWQPTSWDRLRKLPADLNPTAEKDADQGPPAEIDVYVAGKIHWAEVVVPKSLEVIDQRLESHGFTLDDGTVIEGKVFEMATQKPIVAHIRLEEVAPQPKGGYHYNLVAQTTTDAQGHWVLKKTPAIWHRVVVQAAGFVPRVAGYDRSDGKPRWSFYDCGLAAAGQVAGRIMDDAKRPLAGVEVRLDNVVAGKQGRYESSVDYTCKTDADGRFKMEIVPIGSATVWIHKPGYCRPGLGPSITVPTQDVALAMIRSAAIRVKVDFGSAVPPQAYIVEIEPNGNRGVGSWGGSGNIDAHGQMSFNDVPPGQYVIKGYPNPHSPIEETNPLMVELKGGETKEFTLLPK
jgi:hypothetical protein